MEIFVVGGAVRDEQLGKIPKDIDYVVVGATSKDMIKLGFSQVGADFPVFLHPKSGDEYALARTERKVGIGYHGFEVTSDPSTTLADDLSRRDLTINAMAKSVDGKIFDPFNGMQDLKDKILRHVSPAFAEDPLRVVRLARFFARFSNFTIAPETVELAQLVVLSGELDHLPHERFWAELEKVMGEKNPTRFFEAMNLFGMDEHTRFFGELYGDLNNIHVRIYLLCVMDFVVALEQDPKQRMMYHTALTAPPESQTIISATMATQNLHGNIQRVRAMKKDVDGIFDILQAAKAWSQSPDTSYLVMAMAMAEHAGEKFAVSSQELGEMWYAAKLVSSESFSEVGKALGEAIKQGRKDAIATTF